MDDASIRAHITGLVATEKQLREELAKGELSVPEEHERLRRVEVELDQLWDLLRQREARREFGGDPGAARERPGDVVEGYQG